eukprot:3819389-Pleurochrysis_carterae.AAC.3
MCLYARIFTRCALVPCHSQSVFQRPFISELYLPEVHRAFLFCLQETLQTLASQIASSGEGQASDELNDYLRTLTTQKGELHKQLHGQQALHEELRKLQAENERLRSDRAKSGGGYVTPRPPPTALTAPGRGAEPSTESAMLALQLREMSSHAAQLESEQVSLKRRATVAEEQLNVLQSSMANSLATYQREILRLRGKSR